MYKITVAGARATSAACAWLEELNFVDYRLSVNAPILNPVYTFTFNDDRMASVFALKWTQ